MFTWSDLFPLLFRHSPSPPFLVPDIERIASHSFERDSENPIYRHAARERDRERDRDDGRPISSYMDGSLVSGAGDMMHGGDRRGGPMKGGMRTVTCFKVRRWSKFGLLFIEHCVKILTDALVHQCGQAGHLANQCPNPSVPGNVSCTSTLRRERTEDRQRNITLIRCFSSHQIHYLSPSTARRCGTWSRW
jgi:hypothetical protein